MNHLDVSLEEFPHLFNTPPKIIVDGLELLPREQHEFEIIRNERSGCDYYGPNFTWDSLNSLRDKYAAIDEILSFRYINRLLSAFLMDDYMLNIMSGWQSGLDDNSALRWLLTYAERYPQFFHVRCSCLIRATQIFAEHGSTEEAQQICKALLDTEGIESTGYLRLMKHLSRIHPDAELFVLQDNPFQNSFFNLTPDLMQQAHALLQKHGLEPSESLLKRIRPCIKFKPTTGAKNIGDSRLGGFPDVPPGWVWPKKLEFLAQFNLEDLAPHDVSGLLPKRGLLQLFAPYDWSKRDNYRIDFYDGELAVLQPATPPSLIYAMDEYVKIEGSFHVYRPITIVPFNAISLPTYYTCYEEEDEKERVAEAFDLLEAHSKSGWRHQMFGHHSSTESNVLVDIWEQETGRSYHDLNDQERKVIEPELNEWLLLFQMDSCVEVGTSFPNKCVYYFMIHKDDLAALRFDHVYVASWSK